MRKLSGSLHKQLKMETANTTVDADEETINPAETESRSVQTIVFEHTDQLITTLVSYCPPRFKGYVTEKRVLSFIEYVSDLVMNKIGHDIAAEENQTEILNNVVSDMVERFSSPKMLMKFAFSRPDKSFFAQEIISYWEKHLNAAKEKSKALCDKAILMPVSSLSDKLGQEKDSADALTAAGHKDPRDALASGSPGLNVSTDSVTAAGSAESGTDSSKSVTSRGAAVFSFVAYVIRDVYAAAVEFLEPLTHVSSSDDDDEEEEITQSADSLSEDEDDEDDDDSSEQSSSGSSLGDDGSESCEPQTLAKESDPSELRKLKLIRSLATNVVAELISHIPFESKLSLDPENLSVLVERVKHLAKKSITASAIPDREKTLKMVSDSVVKDLVKAAGSPKKLLEGALSSPEDAEALAELLVTRLSFFLLNPPKSKIQSFFMFFW